MSHAPTESKVFGATIGGGAGATLTAFITWLLGVTVWGVPATAEAAALAVAAVPIPVVGILTLVITVGGIYLGGWLAKHTPRVGDITQEQAEAAARALARREVPEEVPADQPPLPVEDPVAARPVDPDEPENSSTY